MDVPERIAEHIALLKSPSQCFVVAICGAADLGKSYLSQALVKKLNSKGVDSECISLDGYLMPREERIKSKISGYNPSAYDLSSVKSDIATLRNGTSINIGLYDHEKGQTFPDKVVIEPCEVLIVEGLHAMHSELAALMNLSVFVFTDDLHLGQIRHHADQEKRRQTVAFSKANLAVELERYKEFVEPYKKEADLLFSLIEKWHYTEVSNPKK